MKLYIVCDEVDGFPILQDPKNPAVKAIRFPAIKWEKKEEEQNDEE